MTLQISIAVKNGQLNSIESTIGTSAIIKIRTGSVPAAITDPDSGTVLATINLPSDWLAAASGGSISKQGTWEDASADATGTAGHFRLYASDGTTVHMQGTVTVTGGGGDLELDNTSIASTQKVTITTFTLTAGN